MSCDFKITSTGTLSIIELNDLGLESLNHPISNLNLINEYGLNLDKISKSKKLRDYIRDGHLIAYLDSITINSSNIDDVGFDKFHKHLCLCVDGVSDNILNLISSLKNVANGISGLDSNGKIPLSQIPIDGDLNYQSMWNASINTPQIPSASSENNGYLYIVQVAGTTNIDGISDWDVGDWLVSNGSIWEKKPAIPDAVISVAGKTGSVILEESDISDLDKYSESEVDGLLSDKANSVHTHNTSDINNLDSTISNNSTVQLNNDHAISQDNPHNVTKTQVGLGNVTNDSQLKRSANDWSNISEEQNPNSEDYLLIEKNSGGEKAKVRVKNIGGVGSLSKMVSYSYDNITKINSTSYQICHSIIFPGSSFIDIPQKFQLLISIDGNATGKIRIYDILNKNIISESDELSAGYNQLIELTDIYNIPSESSVFEIQGKRISGSGSKKISVLACNILF